MGPLRGAGFPACAMLTRTNSAPGSRCPRRCAHEAGYRTGWKAQCRLLKEEWRGFVSWIGGRGALSSAGAARRSPRRSSDPLAGRCGVWGCVGKEKSLEEAAPGMGAASSRLLVDCKPTPDSANGVAGAPPSAPSGATTCRSCGAQRKLPGPRYFPESSPSGKV